MNSDSDPFAIYFAKARKSRRFHDELRSLHKANRQHCIEVREAGVWETVDYADNLPDALLLASSLCQTVREEWIRISTPDNEIL